MFRILPFVIILLFAVIGSKLIEIMQGDTSIFSKISIFEVRDIKAQEELATHVSKDKKSENEKPPAADLENIQHPDNKSTPEAKHKGSEGYTGDPMNPANQSYGQERESNTPPADAIKPSGGAEFSATELEVLQSLQKRRLYLESRESDLTFKENNLGALEKTIENKVNQLKTLQDQIQSILVDYKKRDEDKMEAIVKVYENMKPQEAAAIFEQIEMPILLDVSERMKEVKLAPILAKMDPYKAKELTVELAKRRRINTKL